jgi:hypothetical protein
MCSSSSSIASSLLCSNRPACRDKLLQLVSRRMALNTPVSLHGYPFKMFGEDHRPLQP